MRAVWTNLEEYAQLLKLVAVSEVSNANIHSTNQWVFDYMIDMALKKDVDHWKFVFEYAPKTTTKKLFQNSSNRTSRYGGELDLEDIISYKSMPNAKISIESSYGRHVIYKEKKSKRAQKIKKKSSQA